MPLIVIPSALCIYIVFIFGCHWRLPERYHWHIAMFKVLLHRQDMQSVDTTASQLLQLAAEQVAATTSSAEIQPSEGEIVTTSLPAGTLDSSQILMQASQQALLHQSMSTEGAHISMSGEDGSQITMDAATSEQAALVLQQLAGENAQVGAMKALPLFADVKEFQIFTAA